MTSAEQTTSLPASKPLGSEPTAPAAPWWRTRVLPQHIALTAVLGLSAVLNVNRLSHNGWANTYYSASVQSMLRSLHNFLFISFDPGGMISVDKPPLGLWVQALSAKAFGFTPLSLLLPEAIAGVLAVAALYWVVKPRFGPAAGLASALALAVFPSFVAVSRDNNLDTLLILLMILACGFGLRAIETGRLRPLLGCAVLVGLAFNTKTFAAYLIVPGLVLGYLVCAPGSLARRAGHLLVGGTALLAVSLSWFAIVELTPASRRPFVGSSLDNTELGLTFGYNGFGRVDGQVGGPGRVPVSFKHGSLARLEEEALRARARHAGGEPRPGGVAPARARKRTPSSPTLPNGRARHPTPFGGATGPLRLLDRELGAQGGWMLPFALLGLIALALWSIDARWSQGRGRRRLISDRPRLAGLIVLGSWFLIEAAVLSLSKGIVHPYYISALGPGLAAMVGGGAVAFVAPGQRRGLRLALAPVAVAATVAAQLTLLRHDHYMHWFWPLLIGGAALGVVALLTLRRWRSHAMAFTVGLLLLIPGVYAASTWQFPVEGTFPVAGPRAAGAIGPFAQSPPTLRVTKALLDYVTPRQPGTRWAVLTEASDTAAPMLLLGHPAGAMGGYGGNDPSLDGRGLARAVERGEARYVVLGGAYSDRGGNAASTAVISACEVIPAAVWQHPPINRNALLLYDCAGRERALRRS
jgi:4-amino-4-deoxy-L-arabinose transferase-like glycosyltransferase